MKTGIKAQASLKLLPEQKEELSALIESWQTQKGLVVASLNEDEDEIYVSFRQVSSELGYQIIKLVDDYYSEEK